MLYIIADGKVEITKKIIEGEDEQLLRLGGRGDMVGEMALIQNAPRAATVRTTTECTVLEMEKSFTSEHYQTSKIFAEAILNIDPLNDAALTYQIKSMQRLKMHDEARMKYQAFVIEYKKAMGMDYPHAFKSLV